MEFDSLVSNVRPAGTVHHGSNGAIPNAVLVGDGLIGHLAFQPTNDPDALGVQNGSITSLTVDRLRYWFEVFRIDTCSISAQMVKRQSFWDFALDLPVHVAVSGLSRLATCDAVPVRRVQVVPNPTPGRLVNDVFRTLDSLTDSIAAVVAPSMNAIRARVQFASALHVLHGKGGSGQTSVARTAGEDIIDGHSTVLSSVSRPRLLPAARGHSRTQIIPNPAMKSRADILDDILREYGV